MEERTQELIGFGLKEKDLTLEISLKIEELFLNHTDNYKVKLSRTTDRYLTLKERAQHANEWGADLFISVHINSANGKGNGYEDYIYSNLSKFNTTSSMRKKFHEVMVKELPLKDRGSKQANYQVLRDTKMPAILTENGFINSYEDYKILSNSKFIKTIAIKHMEAIVSIFR